MRLLHVIPSLDPAAGGPPYVASRLASAQASLGYEVSIASGSSGATVEWSDRLLAAESVEHRILPRASVRRPLAVVRSQLDLKRLIPRFDVVHLHEVWSPLVWTAAKIAKRNRIPYVLTPHGMLDPWCLKQRYWKKRLALALGVRKILDGAAFLHLLNIDEGRLLGPLKLSCGTETIPNGVSLQEVQAACGGDYFQKTLGIAGERTIIFLARLHYKKGLDYLGAAFAILRQSLSDVHLVVAGPDGGAEHEFRRQIVAAGVEKNVHLVGPLYGEEKYAAIRSAACFCLPSRQEGFSVAILEAMACRVPVVVSEACNFPEVAEAGAGHVVPLDPSAIAAALRAVLEDPVSARQMGAAGFELVKSRYTWPHVAKLFAQAYCRVIKTTGE